jgi:peroxiredoxin
VKQRPLRGNMHEKTRKYLDIGLYFSFLIVIGVLALGVYDLRRESLHLLKENFELRKELNSKSSILKSSASYTHLVGTKVPNFSAPYVQGGTGVFRFEPKKDNHRSYLFIFFTPTDCQSCFGEIPFWNELAQKFERSMSVVAIGTAESKEFLRYFVQSNAISIQAVFDERQNLFKRLALLDTGLTPLKILVTSEGLIVNADGSTYNRREMQDGYIVYLTDQLHQANHEGGD